jgi:hypothetical protein
MILELIEEIKADTGTMYAVVKDGLNIKWFVHKESAEAFYNEILANPSVLETKKNILKSQEINVPLEEQNN